MDLGTYLTTPTTSFGPYAWVFFIAQIVLAITGAYLAFLRGDSHPVRGRALRSLGYALLILGGVGTLLGGLRLAAIAPFTVRGWFYVVAICEIALAAYALFYARIRYPARLAEFERASRSGGSRRNAARPQPVVQANGNGGGQAPSLSTPRSMESSGRRDSRRDRKRRSR